MAKLCIKYYKAKLIDLAREITPENAYEIAARQSKSNEACSIVATYIHSEVTMVRSVESIEDYDTAKRFALTYDSSLNFYEIFTMLLAEYEV